MRFVVLANDESPELGFPVGGWQTGCLAGCTLEFASVLVGASVNDVGILPSGWRDSWVAYTLGLTPNSESARGKMRS